MDGSLRSQQEHEAAMIPGPQSIEEYDATHRKPVPYCGCKLCLAMRSQRQPYDEWARDDNER